MRAFITGLDGFLGRRLADELGAGGLAVAGAGRAEADVRDAGAVERALAAAGADVVFHLAAQAATTGDAAESFAVNTLGTVNVLEAMRKIGGAVVVASTGEVYEDRAGEWPYREDESLGGRSAYGAAKACAELAARAMRRSFGLRVAAARTPNLLGRDERPGRLVADLLAALDTGRALELRTPAASHQWLDVGDAAHGYRMIAERLVEDEACPDAFNLAPAGNVCTVAELARRFGCDVRDAAEPPRAARRLDPSRAAAVLGWRAAHDLDAAVANTLAGR